MNFTERYGADGTRFLREAMKSAQGDQKRAVREEYLRGMARAGKAVEAYRAFPGGVDGRHHEVHLLRTVIARFRERHPDWECVV